MKGMTLNMLRGKSLSFGLIGLICITIAVWSWEKNPLYTYLAPTYLLSPGSPVTQSLDSHQGTNMEEDFLDATVVENSKPFLGTPITGSSTSTSSGNTTEDKDLITMPLENKECNYAKGKWVIDKRRPLYSGFGCKQWLSKMWACRLMHRNDFSYEGVRWQPHQCEMPDFEGSKFLTKMQNKTIALIGDSLGRQQFQSLMCMVTGGEERHEVEDVGRKYGLVKARGALRPEGWAYRFPRTNTTIVFYWSVSLCELEPLNQSDPAIGYAVHLDRPVTFLRQYLHAFDVLVLNTGHHWNRGKFSLNRWSMYIGGKPITTAMDNAKSHAVDNIVKWLNSQLPEHPHLRAFYRTISPRHFVNGDWNSGGSCDNTIPLAGGSEVSQNSSIDTIAAGAVKGTGVELLDITAISKLRDEGHISKYISKAADGVHDCLHWCLPGVPDTWNEILCAQL